MHFDYCRLESQIASGTLLLAFLLLPCVASADKATKPLTMSEVLAQSVATDWRRPDPENLMILELASGRVVFELAPQFAPAHVANLRTLIRQRYFDGLAVLRSQENYVVQWGDPAADDDGNEADEGAQRSTRRSLGKAQERLAGEYDRAAAALPFTRLADGDVYAPETGFSNGFPAARDPETGRAWLAHCYGMLGAGRGNESDSGNGAELYVVIGHSPRHLDRNVTLLGRALSGMGHLSVLPRGSGPLGFYQGDEQPVPIRSIRLAADLEPADAVNLEVFRTDTKAFEQLVSARRHRREGWFLDPVGHVELCNVPLPVRFVAQKRDGD